MQDYNILQYSCSDVGPAVVRKMSAAFDGSTQNNVLEMYICWHIEGRCAEVTNAFLLCLLVLIG